MSNVIDLSTVARPARPVCDQPQPSKVATFVARALTPRQERRKGKPDLPPPATETAKNSRLRNGRRDAWWRAERHVAYWRARLDWSDQLRLAQEQKIGDSHSFPQAEGYELRPALVDKWREMVAKQLLTPAPTLAAVTWKQAQLKGSGLRFAPVNKERVERAIADDMAFLAAHPARVRRGTS